jgi:[ribosomal protein S18]-alanine N-acetyltransferase
MEIDQSCFVEGIAYSEEEMRYFLELPSSLTLVAERASKIEGFVIADAFRARRASRLTGRIITIDVAAPAQGTGAGAMLMAAAETELKNAGCDLICLEVAVDNARALRFYKKLGYTVLKTLPRYYLDSIDGLLMAKTLGPTKENS